MKYPALCRKGGGEVKDYSDDDEKVIWQSRLKNKDVGRAAVLKEHEFKNKT